MANPDRLKYLATRGYLGHDALLDPDAFVAQAMPKLPDLGTEVAQNNVNEFGLADRLKISIPKEVPTDSFNTSNNIRTKEQAAANENLLKQGYSVDQIRALEQNK